MKLNENNNVELRIRENFEGRLFVMLNGIEFMSSLKLSTVSLFYFMVSGSTIERLRL